VLALGCSSADLDAADSEDFDTALQTDDTDEDVDESTDATPDVSYWGLGGILGIDAEGEVTPESLLELSQRGEDACDLEATVLSFEPRIASSDDLVAEWSLEVEPTPSPDCPWQGPVRFEIGFGLTDPALTAPAERLGLVVDGAYGLYLDPGTGRLLVGVVGTAEQLAGEDSADLTVAPAEGTYRLYTLYGVPLEGT
jgi:hypothetical protein